MVSMKNESEDKMYVHVVDKMMITKEQQKKLMEIYGSNMVIK